jgi:hypothetical protein
MRGPHAQPNKKPEAERKVNREEFLRDPGPIVREAISSSRHHGRRGKPGTDRLEVIDE